MIGCAVNPNTSVAEENRTAMIRSQIVDRKDRKRAEGRVGGDLVWKPTARRRKRRRG